METLRHELASLTRAVGSREKLGLGDVQKVREELAAVQHEFGQLDASIKEKQAGSRIAISEEDYQKLYELDTRRRHLSSVSRAESKRSQQRRSR